MDDVAVDVTVRIIGTLCVVIGILVVALLGLHVRSIDRRFDAQNATNQELKHEDEALHNRVTEHIENYHTRKS